ncbi:MAG: hypothetical protein Q8916_03405 [Bacteroidota bacterium]|nr:hypothetical protein [Bacteroidota bacterium]MDP4229435.1 hypothetical protein [Bacteroidota bacterium]MDP4236576.1 hypothetical protein [Bacteroidota bacterium]
MAELVSPKSALFSLREKRFLRYIVLFVVISRIVLMFRSEERIYTRPYLEDSFYLFNCAEHFANGEGFTCDGTQATNGVQPLVVIFYAPLFLVAGANKLLALKLAFILIALFDVISTLLAARLVRLLQKKPDIEGSPWFSPPIVAAVLWACLYPIFVHTGSGLETGLYSTMLLASLCYYSNLSRLRDAGQRISLFQWMLCGLILGFTVLARIDSVFLVIAIACYEIYRLRAKGILSGMVISIVAFIVSSPWWIYNYRVFGSIMPQSGVSESLEPGLLAENLRRGAIVIGDIFTVFFFLPNYELPAWFHFFWFAALTAIVVLVAKRSGAREYLQTTYSLSSLTPYYFFCAAIVIYYIFFFSAPHFLPRYFQPFRIVWLVLFACITPKFISSLRDFQVRSKRAVLAFIWVFALCAFGFSASRYGYYFLIEKSSDFYRTGKYALEHSDKKIGMEQSGTAGFIASNVVNLDGKVNFAALQAIQKGDIGGYVQSAKLDYIADWREFSERIVESAAKHGARFQEIDSIGRIVIFKRVE